MSEAQPAGTSVRPGPGVLGVATAVLGGAMAGLPFLPWYGADLPSGREVVSGVSATGEVWTLPALGAVVALMGVLLALGRPAPGSAGARSAGALVAVAGTLGVALAGKNVLQVPVQVVAERGSQGTAPLPQAAVGIDVLAAGWMTVCVSALAVVCGLLAMRRPR